LATEVECEKRLARRWKKQTYALTALGMLAAALAIWKASDTSVRVTKLHTHRWYGSTHLQLRYLHPDSDVVVMANWNPVEWDAYGQSGPTADVIPIQDVNAFDTTTNQLSIHPPEAWIEATGEIVTCHTQRTILTSMDQDYAMMTAASKWGEVLYASRSLSKNSVAVLSFAGGRSTGFPFLSGGAPLGPFYHQLFTAGSMLQVGPTYRWAETKRRESEPLPCWTNDERFVVYYDSSNAQFLWVVPLPDSSHGEIAN
jgi:hypothetical protein